MGASMSAVAREASAGTWQQDKQPTHVYKQQMYKQQASMVGRL